MSKKNSNVVPTKISVKIYDGLTLLCGSDNFDSTLEARNSAERIIKQKEVLLNTSTAYAMVFEGKKMLYYFE